MSADRAAAIARNFVATTDEERERKRLLVRLAQLADARGIVTIDGRRFVVNAVPQNRAERRAAGRRAR